jgi:hypothetical protein
VKISNKCDNSCDPPCNYRDPCGGLNVCVAGVCQWQNTTCAPKDSCSEVVCDLNQGCINTPKNCDDNDACTSDSCDLGSGLCVNTLKNCTAQDLCSTSVCNPATGSCDTTPINCNDGVNCTADVCDPLKGCVSTPDNAVCELFDKCHSYVCNKTLGCVSTDLTCSEDGLNCTQSTCVPYQGCNNQAITCNTTDENNPHNCSTSECRESEKRCVLEERTCAVLELPIVITVAALSAGVIAGIVIAVVAFVACAGGASYAAYTKMATGGVDATVNNPLYKGQGRQGQNPLFRNT